MVEGTSVCFRLQIGQGTLHAHCRESHANLKHLLLQSTETEIGRYFASGHIGEVVVDIILAPKAVVAHLLLVLIAIIGNGMRQGNGKVGIILACPAVGDTITGEQRGADDTQVGPERLAFIIVNAVTQIENKLSLVRGEGVLMNAHTLRGRQLGPNAIVGKHHLIISRRTMLGLMAVAGTIASLRCIGRAGIRLNTSRRGHNEDITQVGMPRTTQMCVAESHNGGIMILVAGTIGIDIGLITTLDVVRYRVGVGA